MADEHERRHGAEHFADAAADIGRREPRNDVAVLASAAREDREHRAEHRNAERRADHACGVDEAGCGSGSGRRHVGDRDGVHRPGVEAEAAADHEQHPIYTGLLLGFAGSALAIGEWRGILALVIVTVALWRKLRVEERQMQQQFGDAYRAYQRRVSALIPFLL